MKELPQTPIVTAADVNRVFLYWSSANNPAVYYLVPQFMRDVACGFRPATPGAISLARTYWDDTMLEIQELVLGS